MFKIKNLCILSQAVNAKLTTALGIVFGALSILMLYILSVWFYFVCKKRWAYYKAKIEMIFIGVAVVLSFAAKLGVFIRLEGYGNFGDGMNLFWQALYASIGGLTFEGLSEIDSVDIIWQCLYYGSSIFAGLITLTILTLGLSYELYSYMQLLRGEKNRDVYVFTALTEETLQLARSIKEQVEKPIIVFSGYDLEAFDKHDDLCRQVAMEGFLYWSFYRRNGKKKKCKSAKGDSLAKILHIDNKNIRRERNDKLQERRFCIMAFESIKHIPEEENNIGLVVDDITNRISNIENDSLRIEYYILTKRDINYQAYIQRQKELVIEFAETLAKDGSAVYKEENGRQNCRSLSKSNKAALAKLKLQREDLLNGILQRLKNVDKNAEKVEIKEEIWQYCCCGYLKDWKGSFGEGESAKGNLQIEPQDKEQIKKYFKALKDEYCKHFVVTAINEALIISKDVISDLNLPFEDSDCVDAEKGGEKFIAYLLGFGSTGQAIAKALHMRSAYENCNGYACQTHFEVFDGRANEISGLFAKEHPMWSCDGDTSLEHANKSQAEDNYIEEKKKRLSRVYNGAAIEENLLEKEIVIPTVYFHQKSCFDMSIIKTLDNVTGANENDGTKRPSVIAIALGSDYDNVRMANALIADIIREEGAGKSAELQTILVNIWDANNNMLVDTCGGVWSNGHKTLYLQNSKLTVRIVGNNTDIYSYKKMLSYSEDAQYNEGYNLLYGYIYGGVEKKINSLGKIFIKADGELNYEEAYETIKDVINQTNEKIYDAHDKYEKIDMWKRESNACVRSVGKMFYKLVGNRLVEILSKTLEEDEHFKKAIKDRQFEKAEKIATVEAYRYLSKVEHQRWVRCYIANGWKYANEKIETRKYHDCILPFEKLGEKVALLDIINVIKMLAKEDGGFARLNTKIKEVLDKAIKEYQE